MARPAERPPSEQGVEFRTLDAIAELKQQVAELAQRPLFVPQGNWWDVLGPVSHPSPEWAEIFPQGTIVMQLPAASSPWYPLLRAQTMADRIELTLQVNGGWTIWQRALFFDRREGPR